MSEILTPDVLIHVFNLYGDAYYRGRRECEDGGPTVLCPYDSSSVEASAWMCGWIAAFRKAGCSPKG
jgi:hypothetical protein